MTTEIKENERKLTIARAMAEALAQEMRIDPRVFVMGEDIGALGGVYGNTRGLIDEFGAERVRDTPISETAFVGAAVGMPATIPALAMPCLWLPSATPRPCSHYAGEPRACSSVGRAADF